MTATVDPITVALRVGRALDALGVRHTIGGSIAASFAGEPRSTIDIDFVVALNQQHVAPLVAALPDFYVAEEALYSRWAAKCPTGNGATYSASFARREAVWTDTTWM